MIKSVIANDVVATQHTFAAASGEIRSQRALLEAVGVKRPPWLGACVHDKVSLVKVKLHNSMHSVLVR